MRFEKIQNALDALGTAVLVNLLLAVTASPLIVIVMFTNAFETWPLAAAAAVVATPGVTAAFTVFRRSGENPFFAFFSGYRATWKRAALVGLMLVGSAAVLIVDARFFADGPFAQAAMVVLVVVGVLVAGAGVVTLTAVAESPAVRIGGALARAAWASIRRWHLTLVSLAVLAVFALLFINLPLLALSALASPALYLAWANSRHSLRPVLDIEETIAA
ncbi:DUF624 domain-containing protein [Agromyces intestinalis]|uniref:DUF624 domain-containing protein n=1 Tax=Agromyces intestinalis TaxID=2592652 RepID=A0A5C1YDE1_9MICO|nr:DUF624 domain-containing protein [Agromyces intestinalis]QEO14076.1 DUF624 domain-containing protein [Agromyces intestinalis]